METIELHYQRSPSALANLVRAFATFGRSRHAEPPQIRVTRAEAPLSAAHIEAFDQICQLNRRDQLHLLYPLTLAYPLLMRLLSHKQMPFSMTQVLNTRTVITQQRPIAPNERISLSCSNTPWRNAARGLELDVTVKLRDGSGATCWSSVVTYLIRGARSEQALPALSSTSLAQPPNPAPLARWLLEPRDRFRFARHSGDTNGIHWVACYARRFGFKRDFAQPIRILARCVDELPTEEPRWPRRLEFQLKGPVYYGRELTLSGAMEGGEHRFMLHIEGEQRPCVLGAFRQGD